jgi:GT2 family glycosyltransferase
MCTRGMKDPRMEISVIIPSYNTQDTLGATLDALDCQQDVPAFEVIVVDCSDTDAVEQIVSQRPRVRILRRTQRFNPGEGRNIGAREAQGRLLMFVDADVTLRRDALCAALAYWQKGNRMFGGALELNEERADTASYLEHYFFNHESQIGRPEGRRNNLSSALMLVERELFLSAGGFRDIPRMQDTELSERLRAEGIELTFTPTVVGYQIQDSPLRKVLRKVYLNGRNLYFIRYAQHGPSRRILFLGALPAISAAKTARIIVRHLRYQDLHRRLITLAISPCLALAGAYWMAGFYAALIFRKGISRER